MAHLVSSRGRTGTQGAWLQSPEGGGPPRGCVRSKSKSSRGTHLRRPQTPPCFGLYSLEVSSTALASRSTPLYGSMNEQVSVQCHVRDPGAKDRAAQAAGAGPPILLPVRISALVAKFCGRGQISFSF